MHSLELYTIRVPDKALAGADHDRNHQLDSIYGKDLLALFHAFAVLHEKSGPYTTVVIENVNKGYKTSSINLVDRKLYGYVEYAEYGVKGRIDDVTDGSTKYKKGPKESDTKSLYFCISIPAGAKTGYAAFHNIHGKGIKGLFASEFQVKMGPQINGLNVRIETASFDEAAQAWADKAQVKALRLTKYIPKLAKSDLVDQLGENTVEVVIRPKGKGKDISFGFLKDICGFKNGKADPSAIVSGFGTECHSVKAVVQLDGRRRTFKLSSGIPISSIEIDEDTDVIFEDGAPTLDSLHKHASELLDGLKGQT